MSCLQKLVIFNKHAIGSHGCTLESGWFKSFKYLVQFLVGKEANFIALPKLSLD